MSNYTTDRRLMQWTESKKQTQHLARILRAVNDRRWTTVAQCSSVVGVKFCPECKRLHILPSWACRYRLCPTCQIRRARLIGGQARSAYGYLAERGQLDGVRLILVTLTQQNVSPSVLRAEVDRLLSALSAMRQARDVRRYLVGSARNIEITYNSVMDTYHPHVHMIAMISPDAPEDMLTSAYWRALWARLMHLDYNPVCDARPIEDTAGAICEVSKYVAKSQHMLQDLPDETLKRVIPTIDAAIAGRRLTSYTGIWREARKILQLVDDPDPTSQDGDEQSDVCGCGAALTSAVMIWSGCEYVPIDTPLDDASLMAARRL